nr:hypothetical protein [Azospirillum oryzae]
MQHVSGAAVVAIAASVFGQKVVGGVVDAAKAVGGAVLVAFGRMVLNDVEDDFDVCSVQRLDQCPKLVELADRLWVGCVGVMQGEEVERHVPPVISLLRIELEHGHQFDRRDAEIPHVWNFVDQAREGAPPVGRNAGVCTLGEAADMQFIDDGVVGMARSMVAGPVEACPF